MQVLFEICKDCEIFSVDLDVLPRVGDHVELNGEIYIVMAVVWHLVNTGEPKRKALMKPKVQLMHVANLNKS